MARASKMLAAVHSEVPQ